MDLPDTGHKYTWSKTRIFNKIDRVLVNAKWCSDYPNASAEFLAVGVSDYSSVIVSMDKKKENRKLPFKYFNFWADIEGYKHTIQNTWGEKVVGNPMYRLNVKMKNARNALIEWRKNQVGDEVAITAEAKSQLTIIQDVIQRYNSYLNRFAALDKFIINGKWTVPVHIKEMLPEIFNSEPPISIVEGTKDIVVWTPTTHGEFDIVVADHTESSTISVNLVYLCFDTFSSIGAPKSSLGFGVASSALGSGRRSIAEADVPVLSSIGVDSVKQGDVDTEGLGSYIGNNSGSYVNYESNSGDYN
ncbi:hypothetical protein GIB67_003363 [Kingdonia uniflora]|uniref:Uncharacterized protein n=1 Tax=Kingdonia uniflora TaxID=39325 RepID=A0A7J7P8U6_9MAGN|nr:hypothetical protein GIB67_003363 [Kingdonia uniflora]